MFERFTERARQVVVLALDEARSLRHDSIGTEHILLGLLRESEGIAARVLESLGITHAEVREQVVRLVGQRDDVATGQIPFTPHAKSALEFALHEGVAMGHQYIGTEHLLLGLVRLDAGVATRILLQLDVGAEMIRREVIRELAGASGQSAAGSHGERAATTRTRPARRAGGGTDGPPRLTPAARKVLMLAQAEARALRHEHMGTEHLLLALLREEQGLAARLLDGLAVTLDDVRAQVVRIAGEGEHATTGHIPFTPQAKKALARARSEALSLEHHHVGTEHLLLGLLRQEDGIAARILRGDRH